MKIKKSDLINMMQEQNNVIDRLIHQVNCHHKDIVRLESIIEPKSQLKQLDQSIFDGLDEKWQWAAVDSDGDVYAYLRKPINDHTGFYLAANERNYIGGNYDASNWQNSLIERDIAKELLEVDLSSELTGSELCRAMLERGDKFVMCAVSMADDETALSAETVTLNRIVISLDKEWLYTDTGTRWHYAVPINNQGEPLTASEVGL